MESVKEEGRRGREGGDREGSKTGVDSKGWARGRSKVEVEVEMTRQSNRVRGSVSIGNKDGSVFLKY